MAITDMCHSAVEILIKDDDWIGMTDPVERKKRQNRLHQRAWRRRKAQEKAAAIKAAKATKKEDDSVSSSPSLSKTIIATQKSRRRTQLQTTKSNASAATISTAVISRLRQMAHDHVSGRHRIPTDFARDPPQGDILWTILETLDQPQALLAYWGDLQAHRRDELLCSMMMVTSADTQNAPKISQDHHLFCMIQYNALRGIMANTHLILRLRGDQSVTDGNWDVLYTEGVASGLPPQAPSSLVPTQLQESVPHEAWIDVIPCPGMRDNIIRLQDEIDVDALCVDLMGGMFEQQTTRPDDDNDDDAVRCDRGLVLWGEPWAVANWEVGDRFVRKWACLLQDCDELVRATNRWREIRGEERVVVEVL